MLIAVGLLCVVDRSLRCCLSQIVLHVTVSDNTHALDQWRSKVGAGLVCRNSRRAPSVPHRVRLVPSPHSDWLACTARLERLIATSLH